MIVLEVSTTKNKKMTFVSQIKHNNHKLPTAMRLRMLSVLYLPKYRYERRDLKCLDSIVQKSKSGF